MPNYAVVLSLLYPNVHITQRLAQRWDNAVYNLTTAEEAVQLLVNISALWRITRPFVFLEIIIIFIIE
jgi:hypothetical protein